ncbi:MAG: hypothetical protein JXK07_08550 [Spirochaetes bacterium]|nr:hypothetical protein [Spirochaetota bacterium]
MLRKICFGIIVSALSIGISLSSAYAKNMPELNHLKTKQLDIIFAEGMEDAAHNTARIAMDELLFVSDITGSRLGAPVTICLEDPLMPELSRNISQDLIASPLRTYLKPRSILICSYPDYRKLRRKIKSDLTDILLDDLLSSVRYRKNGIRVLWKDLPTAYRLALKELQMTFSDPDLPDPGLLLDVDSVHEICSGNDKKDKLLLVLDYIVKKYGADTVGRMTLRIIYGASFSEALSSELAISSNQFLYELKNYYVIDMKTDLPGRSYHKKYILSEDERYAVAVNDGIFTVYTAASGLPNRKIVSYKYDILTGEFPLGFTSDSSYFAAAFREGEKRGVVVYSLKEKKEMYRFMTGYRRIYSASVDSKLETVVFSASTGRSNEILFLKTENGYITKIASGAFLVRSPRITFDGKTVFYLSNKDSLSRFDRFSDHLYSYSLESGSESVVLRSNYGLDSLAVNRQGAAFMLQIRNGRRALLIADKDGVYESELLSVGTNSLAHIRERDVLLLVKQKGGYKKQYINVTGLSVLSSDYNPEAGLRQRSDEDLDKRQLTSHSGRTYLKELETAFFLRGENLAGGYADFVMENSTSRYALYGTAAYAKGGDEDAPGAILGAVYRGFPLDVSLEVYKTDGVSILRFLPPITGFDSNLYTLKTIGGRASVSMITTNSISISASIYGENQSVNNGNDEETGLSYGSALTLFFGRGSDSSVFYTENANITADYRYCDGEDSGGSLLLYGRGSKGIPVSPLFYAETALSGCYINSSSEAGIGIDFFNFSEYLYNPVLAEYAFSGRAALYFVPFRRYHSNFFRGSVGIGPFAAFTMFKKQDDDAIRDVFSGLSIKAGSNDRLFLKLDAFYTADYEDGEEFRLIITSGVRF